MQMDRVRRGSNEAGARKRNEKEREYTRSQHKFAKTNVRKG